MESDSEGLLLRQLCTASIRGEREFQLFTPAEMTVVRHAQLPGRNLGINMADFVLLREAGSVSVIEESTDGCTFVVSPAGFERAAPAD